MVFNNLLFYVFPDAKYGSHESNLQNTFKYLKSTGQVGFTFIFLPPIHQWEAINVPDIDLLVITLYIIQIASVGSILLTLIS